jgi:hypothetical protein
MGKRGPAPKGEYAGKSSVFSTRIRPDLRKWLEKATKQSGRSLSQEVEHRLRRSFVEDDKIAEAFGDRRTFRLMRMMADAIHLTEEKDAEAGDWLSNPYSFHVALNAALSVLRAVEPPGLWGDEDAIATFESNVESAGQAHAEKVWHGVASAKASIELNEGSHSDHINSVAQSDIGLDMLKRVYPPRSPPRQEERRAEDKPRFISADERMAEYRAADERMAQVKAGVGKKTGEK